MENLYYSTWTFKSPRNDTNAFYIYTTTISWLPLYSSSCHAIKSSTQSISLTLINLYPLSPSLFTRIYSPCPNDYARYPLTSNHPPNRIAHSFEILVLSGSFLPLRFILLLLRFTCFLCISSLQFLLSLSSMISTGISQSMTRLREDQNESSPRLSTFFDSNSGLIQRI